MKCAIMFEVNRGEKMKEFWNKFLNVLKTAKEKTIFFFKNNVLFALFIISMVINSTLLRCLTVKNFTAISPILADLAFVLFVGSF